MRGLFVISYDTCYSTLYIPFHPSALKRSGKPFVRRPIGARFGPVEFHSYSLMPVEEGSLDGHRRYVSMTSQFFFAVPCLVLLCGLAIYPAPADRRWNLGRRL